MGSNINFEFSGVAAACMPASFHGAHSSTQYAIAAHPAGAGWLAAAAIAPQGKRRTAAAATGASVIGALST